MCAVSNRKGAAHVYGGSPGQEQAGLHEIPDRNNKAPRPRIRDASPPSLEFCAWAFHKKLRFTVQ